MNVVTRAIMTIIAKIRPDKIPRSYPIFKTTNSINPRVFIKTPIENESRQLMFIQRAANMLPPWSNIPKLGTLGVDLIAISGGKHMRGPQCSGILAGRKDLIRAALLNSSPNSDSLGRPMKAGREEIVGCWLACEKYAKLDFDALDRESERQAAYLVEQFQRIKGLTAEKTPFDRTRRVHRVKVTWDESKLGINARQVMSLFSTWTARFASATAAPRCAARFGIWAPATRKFC